MKVDFIFLTKINLPKIKQSIFVPSKQWFDASTQPAVTKVTNIDFSFIDYLFIDLFIL